MIVSGGSRSASNFFARHLTNRKQNERVELVEMRGLMADDVRGAFDVMKAIAQGAAARDWFYHCHLNPRAEEVLTPAQWTQAVDIVERHLRLEGQPRFVVAHRKQGREQGREHQHVIWLRIDPDTMTVRPDGLNYRAHERAAREIETAFNLAPVGGALVREKGTARPERRPSDKESFRGQESGLDPKAISDEVTALWHSAGSGSVFAAASAERGFIIAKGDRRDFVLIDRAGDDHSLGRRLVGVKAAEIRARMADIDRDGLPSVAEARAMARKGSSGNAPVQLTPQPARGILPGSQRPIREVPPGARRPTGEPARVNGWGYEWRAFADRAATYAATVLAHWLDEAPGPWRRLARDAVGIATTPRDHGKASALLADAAGTLAAILGRPADRAETWRERVAGRRCLFVTKKD